MTKCADCVVGLLGPCNDYCAFERELLEEQAQRLSEAQGHTAGPFTKISGEAIWEAHCTRCGLSVSISMTPGPNQPDIFGGGLTQPCAVPPDQSSLDKSPSSSGPS
jgi:hypothetical protein